MFNVFMLIIIQYYSLFSSKDNMEITKEAVRDIHTIVTIGDIIKLLTTTVPIDKPLNSYSSIEKPTINILRRYNIPKDSKEDTTNVVKKFSLTAINFNTGDAIDIAITNKNSVAIK